MTFQDILNQCNQQIALQPEGATQPAMISLFMQGNGRGERRKLAPLKGAPMGQIAAQYEDSDMVLFKAQETADFIKTLLPA